MVRIRTVTGPISPGDLGATLMHEHLTSLVPGPFLSGGQEDDAVELAERAVACLPAHGITTLVDLTGRSRAGRQEDVLLIREIAKRTGLQIVVGFSYYKEPYEGDVAEADLDQLTATFVAQAVDGINGSGVPAGVYGEVGTSFREITSREERHLRAAARAHQETGLAICTHSTLGTMGIEQAAILADEGADLSRAVIGHVDLLPDVDYIEKILRTGVNVAFDTFGKETFDYRPPSLARQTVDVDRAIKLRVEGRADTDRLAALVELVQRGYERQIVLSTDMSGMEAYLNPTTHGQMGYAYLPERILPRLREAGVGEGSIRRMLVENPARILALPDRLHGNAAGSPS